MSSGVRAGATRTTKHQLVIASTYHFIANNLLHTHRFAPPQRQGITDTFGSGCTHTQTHTWWCRSILTPHCALHIQTVPLQTFSLWCYRYRTHHLLKFNATYATCTQQHDLHLLICSSTAAACNRSVWRCASLNQASRAVNSLTNFKFFPSLIFFGQIHTVTATTQARKPRGSSN